MTVYDAGSYNRDETLYASLINKWYESFPEGITLPPEYAHFVKEDLLRLLIRLARYKFVARLVSKTDHVLEVGSGSGIGSIFISQHCAKVTGIEVKKTEVSEARAINCRPNVSFMEKDLFKLEASEKYDVVLALDVIEHMPLKKGRDLIRAMLGHLKPTGMLVIGTPSKYSWQYQGPESKASHVKCYDQKELLDLLGEFFNRTLPFSMNDEMVHTGHPKMAWYYFLISVYPKLQGQE